MKVHNTLRQVTPLSKYLAMSLFIILPFVGGYIGYQYGSKDVAESGNSTNVMNQNQEQLKYCEVDTDCKLVTTDCADCDFDTVAKNELTSFHKEKKIYCENNPPRIMCDAIFTGEVKCINKRCELQP